MIFEILKLLFILLIAVPFIYMMYDVTADVLKRFLRFYRSALKPIPVRVKESSRR